MAVLTNSTSAYFVCDVSERDANEVRRIQITRQTTSLCFRFSTRWPSPQLTSTNVSVISLFNYQ